MTTLSQVQAHRHVRSRNHRPKPPRHDQATGGAGATRSDGSTAPGNRHAGSWQSSAGHSGFWHSGGWHSGVPGLRHPDDGGGSPVDSLDDGQDSSAPNDICASDLPPPLSGPPDQPSTQVRAARLHSARQGQTQATRRADARALVVHPIANKLHAAHRGSVPLKPNLCTPPRHGANPSQTACSTTAPLRTNQTQTIHRSAAQSRAVRDPGGTPTAHQTLPARSARPHVTATHDRAIPVQATAVQATPVQAVPLRAAPVQAAPGRATRDGATAAPVTTLSHPAEAADLPVFRHGAHDIPVPLLAARPIGQYPEAHGFGLDAYIEQPLILAEDLAIAPDPSPGPAASLTGIA